MKQQLTHAVGRLETFVTVGILAVMAICQGLGAEDPLYYVKAATWQETLLASERALDKLPMADGFEPFESPTFQGGDTPRFVDIDITGAKELWLFVTGYPDVKWGVADWADARLVAPDGTRVSASRLTNELRQIEGQCEVDLTLRSGLYQKMRLGGKTHTSGWNVLADSVLKLALKSDYRGFQAWIGVDDWAGTNGSVRFSVVGARTAARKRLWDLARRDFPDGPSRLRMRWEQEDRIFEKAWVAEGVKALASRYAQACARAPHLAAQAGELAGAVSDDASLAAVRALYYRSRELAAARREVESFNFPALALALEDLIDTFGDRYPKGPGWRDQLRRCQTDAAAARQAFAPASLAAWEGIERLARELESLRREALLANPLLDFGRLLLVKRKPEGDPRRSQWADRGLGEYLGLPKQSSWHLSTIPKTDSWENEIAVLSPVRPEGRVTTLYRPERKRLLSDIDLHFDARKILFSMPDDQLLWQVQEIRADGGARRQLTPGDVPDVHNYDACYLPNGNIAFLSTAVYQGVPCNAGVNVGMMYLMDKNGGHIRQVCFEQDHDYGPVVMNDGRIMYLRWDYTDTPHVWNRVLMTMNPDGTGQMENYGSGSYWPNAIFFARPIPHHPTQFAGIVTGHHEGRVGELVVFDPARGRHEAEGVVQRIPGYGQKVEPKIEDKLTEHSWPKCLHPFPLSEHYFLVACKPEPDSLWGIYLVDTFDNRVLLKEEENYALLEPIPFRPTPAPPVIPEKVQPELTNAVVFIQDIYEGPGLKGVPKGTVKSLRLFTYHFGFRQVAGIDHRVGADGPWEIKRVLGTVPVEPDGSAWFRVPAKYPISIQPLDGAGRAVALMRSWFTAMPGEIVSCVGCHEKQGASPPVRSARAVLREPSDIEPWHGPPRGFSFAREVQPVLDKYCLGCHAGQPLPNGQPGLDLRAPPKVFYVYPHGRPDGQRVEGFTKPELLGRYSGVFEPAYVALRAFVRVGGFESDLHVLPPMEFHADTSELIQRLRKGHHGVPLDPDAWDRLVTWIDLNAPCNGTWHETTKIPGDRQPERRRLLRQRYGGIDEDAEEIPDLPAEPVIPVAPTTPAKNPGPRPALAGWPFDAAAAKRRQAEAGAIDDTLSLGNGLQLELTRIPAGSFVMGDPEGDPDELAERAVVIPKAFWMGKFEVSNEQYARFDRRHDSRFEDRTSWIFSEAYLGWPLNQPRQPVVRVSCEEAVRFCQWLAARSGRRVALPSEEQWEYACRAGTATPFNYGTLDTDFSPFANLADASLRRLATEGWRPLSPDLVPRDARFNDGALVTADVGQYRPNAWGLYDMHGNAAEWTRTPYTDPRPQEPATTTASGGATKDASALNVVRGGSWRDRPWRGRSSFRLAYPAYQKVYNVGFRIVVED